MQSERNSLAEKILRDIERVLKRDEQLEEFVIIPTILNKNKSPVIHEQHNLGLESWCVKHVFSYAYQKVLELRKLIAKRKLLYDQYESVNRMILGVLLINPDVSTFWNIRRELVCDNVLDVDQELRLAKLVLSHKFKSNEAFAYRKWLLRRIINDAPSKTRINNLLSEERFVCNMTAEKYQNNYHSWSHRIWCLENLHGYDVNKWLMQELEYSENWVFKHISENAGFHFRQYIINKIKKSLTEYIEDKYVRSFNNYFNINSSYHSDVLLKLFGFVNETSRGPEIYQNLCLLTYDLELNDSLLRDYSEHETIWCHRRSLYHDIFSLAIDYLSVRLENITNLDVVFTNNERECNIVDCTVTQSVRNRFAENGEKFSKMLKCEKNVTHSTYLCNVLMSAERDLLDRCMKLDDRTKYLARRHLKWMQLVLGCSAL